MYYVHYSLLPFSSRVNFKKNEKNFDASTSAVLRMVQEADKEPREPEPGNYSSTWRC